MRFYVYLTKKSLVCNFFIKYHFIVSYPEQRLTLNNMPQALQKRFTHKKVKF